MYNQPEAILDQYDLSVNQITKGRGMYICDTSRGMMLLMPFRGSKERADFLRQILKNFQEEGMIVEQIYQTKENEVLAEDEAGIKYLLKDMFAGSECSTRSREEMKAALELLAQFHRLSNACLVEIPEFLKSEKNSLVLLYEKHNRELVKVKNYVKSRKKKNEFEMKFQEQYPHFIENADCSLEQLRNWDGDTREYCLCHGDFNQHNVLKTKEGWRIVNFEYMNYNLPVLDLANFLRKMLEKNNWNEELGMQLIESYTKVRALSAGEYKQLYLTLLFPEKFWKIANHYYNSHKAWLSGRDIDKLNKVVAQEEARSSFLEKLFAFLA